MKTIAKLLTLAATALLPLLISLPANAGDGGAIAEEIRSMELCRQAVELDKQREGKLTDPKTVCSLEYTFSPIYWQCVVDTMKLGPDLFNARRSCGKL